MITFAHSFTRRAVVVVWLGAALVTTPARAAAQEEAGPRGIWLAGLESQASSDRNLGRLMLRDGALVFSSSTTEWQLALSEIKRASAGQSDQLIVESAAGEVRRITIYDGRMMVDSPRNALKIIRRALRAPAARRE